ncbi:BspA family leucine-rich repeat surface protein [Enterococcus faecium]|uniref:BspA family leucine-rich repeat surface protein n=1 Tax=Enterococcus faecium TaxID=1352 RepID=UPI0022DD9338|nr:BspA family leucine-rich repeat surface protein [Enterococcus faecium]
MKKWSSLLLTGALLFSSGALADIPVDADPNDWVIINNAFVADWNFTVDNIAQTITLSNYIGAGTDVTIPTAADLGYENYTISISREGLQSAAKGKTSLRTSNNGPKILLNAIDLSGCFYNYNTLVSVDLTNLDVSQVTDMGLMFEDCSNLTNLNLNDWDTSHVITMGEMFKNCIKLSNLNVGNWNTSSVEEMGCMFMNCQSLTKLNLSNWNINHMTNMNYMFSNCENLESLGTNNWNIYHPINADDIFDNANKLVSKDKIKILNFDDFDEILIFNLENN